MGIDRFQRARDTGSIYAWVSQTNDPFHYTYEPHQWNAEFEPEIRMQDSGIEVVTLYDFDRHAGGWGANHNSYRNATFTLPENLSSYDTLEVFHEHACDERANRYQKSDGSYGGCHEWDYSHICTFVTQTIHRCVVLNSCAGLQRTDGKDDG